MLAKPETAAELGTVAKALGALFPDLEGIAPLRVLGSGFSNVAVETASGVVYLIARDAAAAARHRVQVRFLPALQPRLPIAIPVPRWHAGPSEAFPFGVMGYHRLPGTPVQREPRSTDARAPLAADLGAFLRDLHAFPLDEAAALGLAGPDPSREELAASGAAALSLLQAALTAVEYGAVARWWKEFLADDALQRYSPAVIHGDLWYENLLVDAAGRLTGVVDWETAHIGDPAQDFTALLYLGERFTTHVIDAYQAAGGQLGDRYHQRLRRWWEWREFDGIPLAAQLADPAEFQDALRKLRAGPILSALSGC